jgi:predicted TIM-barrel fold metal-dependent hydrolase
MTQSLREVGEDHILMATDYPHFDSEFPHTVSGIMERKDLTQRQKEKICGENAVKLLNL